MFNDHSAPAHNILLLWWWMLGAASIVLGGTLLFLALGYVRRRTKGLPFIGEREGVAQGMVVVFGVAIPMVTLVALFGFSDVYLVQQTGPPPVRSTKLTIDVIGHQWWWEVRYPGTTAVTANQIHIPARTRVNIVATTADVIHGFWVPALNRKIDMVPGYRNRVLLYANQPGVYEGQCTDYCGLEHADMRMEVVAQTPAAYRAWLANMGSHAPTPTTAAARTGMHDFMSDQCASCHRIAGTSAQADIGPDLSHLATRTKLAAGTIPNTPSWLARWILNPQAIKPGDRMPDLGLSKPTVAAIVDYLETLK